MISLTQYLDGNWSWKERESSIAVVLDELEASDQWLPTTFPTEIHVDLLKAGKIPDPYKGFNEHAVQRAITSHHSPTLLTSDRSQ